MNLKRTAARAQGLPFLARTSLSLSALFSARLKGPALFQLKHRYVASLNFTCKYSRDHRTAIVFILCVAYLILSDDGTIINQDFFFYILEMGCISVTIIFHISVTLYFIFSPLSDNRKKNK